MPIEKHPLQPFFPNKAQWLFLGSFPPKQKVANVPNAIFIKSLSVVIRQKSRNLQKNV
jgi:hypothetical protein